MSSQAQVAANQTNAQLSSGPKTPEGKAKSSRNALKTGLTGRTMILTKGDAELYEHPLLAYAERFNPESDRETELVQSIADCRWRLGSIPGLEAALYARGFAEFKEMFEDEPEDQRCLLIVGEIMTSYRKDFANLMIQEQRLARRANQEEEELKAMQRKRLAEFETELALATQFYLAAKKENKPVDLSGFGFEFSIEELERHAEAQIHHQTIANMKRAS
ncbi:MAG: hypothetical protein WBW33_28110 [Bryobacteraceae bacterium]